MAKKIKYPVDAPFVPVFRAREGEGEGKMKERIGQSAR